MPTTTTPTIDQARAAASAVLDADEKLYDLLGARNEALVMGLPDRKVQVDDIDAEVTFIRRKLDEIAAYTQRERDRNGW